VDADDEQRSADEPGNTSGGRDSGDGRDFIRPPSKEQRKAELNRIEAIHQKYTSREPGADTEPATQPPVSAGTMPASDLLMLDPSFLFSEGGISWLQEQSHVRQEEIVVSSAFVRWLRSGEPVEDVIDLVDSDDRDEVDERRAALFQLLRSSPTFDSEGVELAREDEEVFLVLRESGGVVAEILADEWAFLQSHSWALSKMHLPLDRFRDAGAAVLEYGRRLREEMVSVVIPQKGAPPAVTRALLAKASAKWLIVGGAGAGGALLGPVGAGILGSGVVVPVVRAFDP
jgi:hypothetical protein